MNNDYMKKCLADNLRSCQLKEVGLLTIFDRICRKHQLGYWLEGGTLLGAIRHEGFIPWDDDIDVTMLSKDYKKFLEIAQAELPQGVFLQTKKTDMSYTQSITKLMDLNSIFLSTKDDLGSPYQKGIYIDIFEFVEYPTMPREWIKKIAPNLCFTQYFFTIKHHFNWKMFLVSIFFTFKLGILKLIWWFCCLLPKGKYISNIIEDNGYGVVHRVDDVFPLKQIKFEGKMFSCPKNPDEYLKILFKNYMELPPPDKRISHAFYIAPNLIGNGSNIAVS